MPFTVLQDGRLPIQYVHELSLKAHRQVMTEIKQPLKTLPRALPTAVGIVTILYILVNVAYFAAIPRDQLLSSGVTVAGQFFFNVKISHLQVMLIEDVWRLRRHPRSTSFSRVERSWKHFSDGL